MTSLPVVVVGNAAAMCMVLIGRVDAFGRPVVMIPAGMATHAAHG